MKGKILFNADVLMVNQENRVYGEIVQHITVNEPCFVEHSIYFAQTLRVFKDEAKTEELTEGLDYTFAELDSIASEMSNKDCYRAILFLTDVPQVWIDYWSYGDIICAETLNVLSDEIHANTTVSDHLSNILKNLQVYLENHIQENAAHGSSIAPEKQTIALRSSSGTVKTATPEADDDAVNAASQMQALQALETRIHDDIKKVKQQLFESVDTVDQKVKAKKTALYFNDFLPENMSTLPPDEKAAAVKKAQEALDVQCETATAYRNAIRNKNGSLVVPYPKQETEAVNLKCLKEEIKQSIAALANNAPEELEALKEITEAVKKHETCIQTLTATLSQYYAKEEADTLFIKKKP